MKKIVFVSLILNSICSFGQSEESFKEEMIESGEGQKIIPEQVKNSSLDYDSFKRAKAWNRKTGNEVFSTPVDLDVSIIGGRCRSSLVDVDNDISLVAPSGGGLWKFNPLDGSSFTPINDFGSFLAVTGITQDPNNAQHIIIATGDEIHRTKGQGLFESTDGGNTFNQITSTLPSGNSDFEYIRYVKFSPTVLNTIYISTEDKVYRSTDNGSSWTEVYNNNKDDISSLEFLSNGGIILAVQDQGIYASPTGDLNSFVLITTTLPNDATGSGGTIDGVVVSTHAANRNIAYAFFTGSSGNDIYKTINGGSSWTKLTPPSFYIAQTWFCLALGVHPTNPNIVVSGSVGWGYTDDGGVTWKSGVDLEVDFHDVHFHTSNPDVAYVGYDQGIGRVDFGDYSTVKWVDNGAGLVQELQPAQLELGKMPGFNTSQIYYGDYFPVSYGDAFLMGQQDGGSFASVNGVQKRILIGDGGSMFVNKQDPTKAYGSTQKGRIKRSVNADAPVNSFDYTDFGSFYENHPNWITQFEGNNADGNQMYIANNTSIQRTLNGGDDFSSISPMTLNDVKIAVENAKNPVVYAMGYSNSRPWPIDIIRIQNAATTPVESRILDVFDYFSGGRPDQISIDPNQRNTIYVTGTSGVAYKITDTNTGSPVITSIKGDIPLVVFNKVIGVKGNNDLLIAGTNVGLFYSEDAGASWVLNTEIPYTQITDLKLRESDGRLFVFTYGRGAWALTVNSELLTSIASKEQMNFDLKIYPNPTKDLLNVFSNDVKGGSVIIYDVKGDVVLRKDSLGEINVGSLQAGVYILHAQKNGTLVGVEKIVIE